MATEIELKVRVASHEPVRERLRALGGEFVALMLETNRIFDRPDRSLQSSGCGLRIRSSKVLDGVGGGATLTFKGPALPGAFKKREEVEVIVESAEESAALLERLGFARILEYQKRRERWRLGGCIVELDGPAQLGLFVEIEGPNDNAIRDVQRRLGLEEVKHISTSYVQMAAKYCEDHGIVDFRLTMDDGK
jgi:adenylate cyclase class 2